MCLSMNLKILFFKKKVLQANELNMLRDLFLFFFFFPLFLGGMKKKRCVMVNNEAERKKFKMLFWLRFPAQLQSR